jgi:hypothetical protein
MTSIQEIVFKTKNNKIFKAVVSKKETSQGDKFSISLQAQLESGTYAGIFSEFLKSDDEFTNVEATFEYLVNGIRTALISQNDDIIDVNNLNNAEFITKEIQKVILSNQGLTITPTLN